MASSSWIPPIPGGKLISKPVRDLGSAVTFLHWCYEAVRRDGTIEFQISEVAGALEESYYTVRKWWSLVKDGPWFEEVTDRGKRGFVVKMSSDWLEWRAYKPSKSSQVHDRAFEDDQPTEPQSTGDEIHDRISDDLQVAVKLPSSGGEVHDQVLETPAYKVLSRSEDRSQSAAQAPRPPAVKKRALPNPEITQAQLTDTPLTVYQQATNVRSPNQAQRELIESVVTDLEAWRTVCEQFAVKGWNVRNVANLIDAYQKRVVEKARAHSEKTLQVNGTNGHHEAPYDYDDFKPYEKQTELRRIAAERRAARKAGAS